VVQILVFFEGMLDSTKSGTFQIEDGPPSLFQDCRRSSSHKWIFVFFF